MKYLVRQKFSHSGIVLLLKTSLAMIVLEFMVESFHLVKN